jgi:hypothetical protein
VWEVVGEERKERGEREREVFCVSVFGFLSDEVKREDRGIGLSG